jgi:hypothetical protein
MAADHAGKLCATAIIIIIIIIIIITVAYLPHAITVESRKPRNTHTEIEI